MELYNPFEQPKESPMDMVIRRIIEAEENIVKQVMKVVLKREPEPEDAQYFHKIQEGDFNKVRLYYMKDNKQVYLGAIEQSYDTTEVSVKFIPNPELNKTNVNG